MAYSFTLRKSFLALVLHVVYALPCPSGGVKTLNYAAWEVRP